VTLNKREQLIASIVGVSLAVTLLYFYVVQPRWIEARTSLNREIKAADADLTRDRQLLAEQPKYMEQWNNLKAKGLSTDPAQAAAHMMQTVTEIARRNFVQIEGMRENRTTQKDDFSEHRFVATASGSTKGVAPFLFALESSGLPLRVDDLQLRARKEGTDDLGMELQVTALVYAPKPAKGAKTPVATAPAATRAATRPALARQGGTPTGVMPTTPAASTGPSEGADAILARMKARREAEAKLEHAVAADTQPTTTPGGAK
jgi:hypothetical protein